MHSKTKVFCRVTALLGAWIALAAGPAKAPVFGQQQPPPPALPGGSLSPIKVAQWDRFEIAVVNTKSYSDPFRDVTLNVIFTRPDASTVSFWGFNDGGALWRIRFMPDQLGVWRYLSRFSDGSAGIAGAFECVASDIPGMLSVYEPNPIWFGFKGGKPAHVRSIHVGDRFFARNWDDPESPTDGNRRSLFLDWAQRQGYNTLSIASHYLNRNTNGRGDGWKTPALWPLDPDEFRYLEGLLNNLARRRMMVFPFAGFLGRDSNFPRDPNEQELYIRYVLARIGPYWNILWNVGGPEPSLREKEYLSREDVEHIGKTIRQLDVFGHPLSVHNPTGNDLYKDSSWSAFGTLQGPKTIDRVLLGRVLLENHHPAKPLFAQETLWPGNTSGHPAYSEDDIRKNANVILMSGGTINFGDMDGNSSSGFSGTLDLGQRQQRRHDVVKMVWDFFESIPYYKMKPRPELVSAGYCLAEPGERYLVYLESPRTVHVKLSGGPHQVEWIDAQNPGVKRAGKATSTGRNLICPSKKGDWLLHLHR